MKNKLITFTAILVFLLLMAGIYVLTPADIPAGAEMKIAEYTRNKPRAEVSIAVVTDDGVTYSAFGQGGREIPVPEREYEIGSLSKTFLGAYLAKETLDGEISLLDHIGDLLPIAQWSYSPRIIDLATHTSAYGNIEPSKYSPFRFFIGLNPYSGITAYDMISEMDNFRLTQQGPFPLSYSDFGVTVLGLAVAEVKGTDYISLMTKYIQDDLGLKNTYFALDAPVRNGWKWDAGDAYAADSGLTSNITDMAEYAAMYLGTERAEMMEATRTLCFVDEDMSVGYLWGLTGDGSIVAHTGESSHYASQILIDKEHRVAVVILSNYRNDKFGNVADIAQAVLDETNSLSLQDAAGDAEAVA